jgi:hypothetical protein
VDESGVVQHLVASVAALGVQRRQHAGTLLPSASRRRPTTTRAPA